MDLVEMDRAYGDLVSQARQIDEVELRSYLFPEIVKRASERTSGGDYTDPCTDDEIRSLERQELLRVDEIDAFMELGPVDAWARRIPVKLRVCAGGVKGRIPWRIVAPRLGTDTFESADELQAIIPLGDLNAGNLIGTYEKLYGKSRISSYLLKPIRAYQYNDFNSNDIRRVIVGAMVGMRVFYKSEHRTLASLAQGV